MKVIIGFWHIDSYARVGMNHRFVIDDGRIRTLRGIGYRTWDIVKRWHISKRNTPYEIRDFHTDELLGYGYQYHVETAAHRDEWFRSLFKHEGD